MVEGGSPQVVPAVELARAIALRPGAHAWFLGAGASAAGNIPTGYDMILDFKARLFAQAGNLALREIDTGDPVWRARLDHFFDGANGLPATGTAEEYAAAFEAVYPAEEDRRAYIASAMGNSAPSYAHRVLGAMAATGVLRCVVSTNFDQLIERAVGAANERLQPTQQRHLVTAALDSADRAARALDEEDYPLYIKLHGDYHSVRLKNTPDELREQDATLRRALSLVASRFGLIVVGYSGRDASVMDVLRAALNGPNPFPHGLWWVMRRGTNPLPAVDALLSAAVSAGVRTSVVWAETFDELAGVLHRELDFGGPLNEQLHDTRPAPRVVPAEMPVRSGARFPVLRCTALPIYDLPLVARQVRLDRPMTTGEARTLVRESGRRAIVAAIGDTVAAYGADVDLLAIFESAGGQIDGEYTLDPSMDSWALGLLYEALVKALARRRPLRPVFRRSGHSITVGTVNSKLPPEVQAEDHQMLKLLQAAYSEGLTGVVPGVGLRFAEGIRVRMEHWSGRWWCVFDPYTWVDRPPLSDESDGPRPYEGDATGDWRKERWARRYNEKWSRIIDGWAHLLVGPGEERRSALGLAPGSGVDAVFEITAVTAWSTPGSNRV